MSVRARTQPFSSSALKSLWAAMLLPALLLVAGCETLFPIPGAPPAGVAAVVHMTNLLDFAPGEIRIRVGDTVEWQNPSLFTHTVTFDPALARSPDNVELPGGAIPFHSSDVPPDGTFRFTFTVPGTYRYVCLPHERLGMVGVVIVEPGG